MSISGDTSGQSLFTQLAASRSAPDRASDLETEVVELFDEMRGRMLRYSLGFGLPVSEAEEVVQDAFLALYRHLLRGKSRASLRAWLFQVAHNLSLKRRLELSRQPMDPPVCAESGQVADSCPNPEDQVAFRQRSNRLRSVFHALPEKDRQCLYLRAEGLRYREIASVLGISLGSVANCLARSLSRLAAVDQR